MKFGLTESEYNYITETVVSPLQKNGAKIYCYGSRARGDFKKFSDLDLMIEAETSGFLLSLKGQIEEQLSNGNFPYKVDLVFLSEFASVYRSGYEADKELW